MNPDHARTNLKIMIIALAAFFALATQSRAVIFDFQQYGSNVDLGPTRTFTKSGISLTASAFMTAGGSTHLYAKNDDPIGGSSEKGLGTMADPTGEHEITTTDFVQLMLSTMPPSHVSIYLGSVQSGESAMVYFNSTSGTLAGATLIGTMVNHDGWVNIPAQYQNGFIDITAGAENVLLETVRTSVGVPDAGATLLLFTISVAAIAFLRRTFCTT
jgi:hypothetical protein